MADAETVRNAIGDNVEARAALDRILGRRDAYVRQVQAEARRGTARTSFGRRAEKQS